MSITSFFATTCETRELHADQGLRTRYYRNNFEACLVALNKLATQEKLDIRDVNKVHGEIYVVGNGFDVIITVAQVSPIESGIDMKVNFFSFMGFGRPRNTAVKYYKFFDQNLKFKGVSLHP